MALAALQNILPDAIRTNTPAGAPINVMQRKIPTSSPMLPTRTHPHCFIVSFGPMLYLLDDPLDE